MNKCKDQCSNTLQVADLSSYTPVSYLKIENLEPNSTIRQSTDKTVFLHIGSSGRLKISLNKLDYYKPFWCSVILNVSQSDQVSITNIESDSQDVTISELTRRH